MCSFALACLVLFALALYLLSEQYQVDLEKKTKAMPSARAPGNGCARRRPFPDIAVKAEAALCEDCQLLFADVTLGPDLNDTRWETIESEHATLTFLGTHQDFHLSSLQESANNGCVLCGLMLKELEAAGETNPTSAYCVFFWESFPRRCEFNIAVGDVHRFINHISEWKQPASIVFFRRNGYTKSPPFSESP